MPQTQAAAEVVADGVGGEGLGGEAKSRASGRRSHADHEFMNCRCVCLEPGSRAQGGSSLSLPVFRSREVRPVPLLNQTPVMSWGRRVALGSWMGQRGQWDCFSPQPFPLHQERMNQLVEMGVGWGRWWGEGGRMERKPLSEKELSPTLFHHPTPKQPPLPLSPFPLLSSLSSSVDENQVSLGQNLSSQVLKDTQVENQ